MNKEAIKAWLLDALSDYDAKDIFLVDFDWKPSKNKLIVYVDSDIDLSLKRCQELNRFLEKQLDESELIGTAYNLSVSSPGLNRPLVSRRQYPKNIGRVLRVVSNEDQELIGKLIEVDDEALTIQLEKKKGRHQKPVYGDAKNIAFEDIKETFVEIRF